VDEYDLNDGFYNGETRIIYHDFFRDPDFLKVNGPTDRPNVVRVAEYYQWRFSFGKMRWVRLYKHEYEKANAS
jgi:hypothetical protein